MKSTILVSCIVVLLPSPAFAQDMQYVSRQSGDTLFVEDDIQYGFDNTKYISEIKE